MEKTFTRIDGSTVEKDIAAMDVTDILHIPFSEAVNTSVNTSCSNIGRLLNRAYRTRKLDELQETLVIRVK